MSCDPITVSIVTDGKHKAVPQEIFQEAEQYAKVGTYPAQNLLHVACMLHEIFIHIHELANMHVVILMYMHVSCNMHGFRTLFMHVPCT